MKALVAAAVFAAPFIFDRPAQAHCYDAGPYVTGCDGNADPEPTKVPLDEPVSGAPPPVAVIVPAPAIADKIAQDAVQKYYFLKHMRGNATDLCVRAGLVVAAFGKAKHSASYQRWRAVERRDCAQAGLPPKP
jgi:hypothetical protein